MVSYRLLNRRIIVVNTIKAITDLLQSRASIYSDRPFSWMLHELLNRKLTLFGISSDNPRFKIYRRLVQTGLNPRAVQSYREILERERNILLRNLESKSSQNFVSYIKQYVSFSNDLCNIRSEYEYRNAAGIILAVTYGWTVTDIDDKLIAEFEEAVRIQSIAMKPGWMVEVIPLRICISWVNLSQTHQYASSLYPELVPRCSFQTEDRPFSGGF